MSSSSNRKHQGHPNWLNTDEINHSNLSRRDFLWKSGLLGLSASALPGFVAAAQLEGEATPPAGDQRYGGVFDHYTPQTIGRIDPLTTQANYLTLLAINTFGQLVTFGEGTWEPVPDLAERWEVSDDLLTYTFYMRPNLTFHDGSPIALSDIVFSLERAREPFSVKRELFEDVTAIEADDVNNSIVVTIANPDLFLLSKMAGIGGSVIVPQAVVEEYGDDFATTVESSIGSGPFRLIEKNDTRLVWERFPEFYEPAFVDSVNMRVIPDPRTQQLEFEAGTVYWINSVLDVDQAERFRNDPTFSQHYKEFPAPSIDRFQVNPGLEPFTDIRVRQAIAKVIDSQLMTEIAGLTTVRNSLLHPDMAGWKENLPAYPRDVEGAKQLMAEAGYGNGFTVDFHVYTQNRIIAQAEVMQQQLQDINVTISIQTADFGTYISEVNKRTYPFHWSLHNMAYPDPAQYLFDAYHSEGSFNTGYENPEVDRMLEEAVAESSELERRGELAAQAEEFIRLDAAVPHIYQRTAAHVFQPWIHGVEDVTAIYPNVRWHRLWIDPSRR